MTMLCQSLESVALAMISRSLTHCPIDTIIKCPKISPQNARPARCQFSPIAQKPNVMSHQRTAKLASAFEQPIIRQSIRAVFLGGDDIDVPQTQLRRNRVIDMNV